MAKKRMKMESPMAIGFRVNQAVRVCDDPKTLGRDRSVLAGKEGKVRFVNQTDEIGVEFDRGVFTLPSFTLTII